MSIYGMIYDELKAKIEHLPQQYGKYQGAFDILDRELIAGIELDEQTNNFWIEWFNVAPEELKEKDIVTLIDYIKQKGYSYLYEDKVTA